jgi:hypothetical protein
LQKYNSNCILVIHRGEKKYLNFRELIPGHEQTAATKSTKDTGIKVPICTLLSTVLIVVATYTEPYDREDQDKSGPEPNRRRRELLLREGEPTVPARRRVGGLGPRGRRRGAAGEGGPAGGIHDAHDHPLARLAARRRAADEVEEPGAAEREPGAAAVREPAQRVRRAAPLVVAQEHRVVVAVLEI